MKTNMQLIRKIQLAFGAVLAILLIVGVISYRSLLASADSQRWVQHTYEVLGHIESLRLGMENVETEYSVFALGGTELSLQEFRAGLSRIGQEQKTLRALTVDNPGQQRHLATLTGLVEQQIRLDDTFTRSSRAGEPELAAIVIRKNRSVRILREFGTVLDHMEATERGLLLKRSADAAQRLRQTKWALILGSALGLLVATLAGWIVQRDSAARGRAEAALLASEELFRTMVGAVQDYAIFMLDPRGTVVSWNAGAERIRGYQAAEIIGQNFSCFYPQEDIDQGTPQEELRIAAASGRFETQRWRVRRDGSRFWANLTITATRASSGDLLGFSEISRDTSELKQMEAKYRGLLEAAPDAMVVVNQLGKIVLLNLQVERQFGYHRDELVGQQVKNIIPEGFAERLVADNTRGSADGLARQIGTGIELSGRRKDGSEFPIEIMLSPLQSDEGILVTAAIRNITERKRSEEHLVKMVKELKLSNDELAHFAYIASHDLQEPLRMVASYTQLLASRYRGRLDSVADEFIGYAVDGAQRMQELIQDLLAYSRAGTSGKALRKVSSENALSHALANLRAAIDESDAVVTHDALPVITADETQLAQIFQNLIGNAIKYQGTDSPRVHVSATKNSDSEWTFAVRDNGMGIEAQYFERIFVLFQRLHGREEFKGTGIGLSICRKMLERLGGRIWVESQLGKGSTFYFALPEGDAG